jgi:CRISPR/Cas system CSM-associated protein Csm5 (group 7 of RAMP superfamily)
MSMSGLGHDHRRKAMLPRHKNELLNRLERVNELGSCEIRTAELKLWYDRERITKGVWADVLEKWEEVGNDDTQLLIGQGEGFYSLIYNDGLTPSEESWWKDLRTWAV